MSLKLLLLAAAEGAGEAAGGGTGETVAHGKSGTGLIIPEIGELIWGAVAFGVLLFLMVKFVFPAIGKALQERSDKIRGDIEGAEASRAEADELLEDYRSKLAGAREESDRIIEEARKTAESIRRDLLAKAEEEASQLVERARSEIASEKKQAVAELYREAGKVSIDLAEKVVGQSLDREAQTVLVDQYIRELEAMSGSGGA